MAGFRENPQKKQRRTITWTHIYTQRYFLLYSPVGLYIFVINLTAAPADVLLSIPSRSFCVRLMAGFF